MLAAPGAPDSDDHPVKQVLLIRRAWPGYTIRGSRAFYLGQRRDADDPEGVEEQLRSWTRLSTNSHEPFHVETDEGYIREYHSKYARGTHEHNGGEEGDPRAEQRIVLIATDPPHRGENA